MSKVEPTKDNFTVLYEIAQKINSILDRQELLEKVLETAMEHLDAERGFIVMVDGSAERGYNVMISKNFSSEKDVRDSAASSSVINKVLTTGEPVLTFDAMSDERFEAARSIVAQQILSVICVPLRLPEGSHEHDRTTGAIYLDSTKSRGKFNNETMKFLSVFGTLAAVAVENAQRYDNLKTENVRLKSEIVSANLFPGIIGKSKVWKAALDLAQRVVDTDISVLVTGESGTGKELVARAIHTRGARSEKPFVAINCSAIPEQLLESELFGYKKGAFTGANADKKGLVEYAEGGTMFLDEVGDLPASLQSKLLRVLQEKEIRRLGEVESRKVNLRIIAATNKDLRDEIKKGNFREDLYFRLNIVEVHLPPLRDRNDDIPILVDHFMKKACESHGRSVKRVDPGTMSRLLKHPWPGNVRELQNAIERAVVLSRDEELKDEDLMLQHYSEEELLQSGVTLEEFERRLVEKTLAETGGNRTRTAEKLGVSLRWLQYRIKEWSGESR